MENSIPRRVVDIDCTGPGMWPWHPVVRLRSRYNRLSRVTDLPDRRRAKLLPDRIEPSSCSTKNCGAAVAGLKVQVSYGGEIPSPKLVDRSVTTSFPSTSLPVVRVDYGRPVYCS